MVCRKGAGGGAQGPRLLYEPKSLWRAAAGVGEVTVARDEREIEEQYVREGVVMVEMRTQLLYLL